MIDIELLRNNPDMIRAEIKKRNLNIDLDSDIQLDEKRRGLIFEVEQLRAKKNEASKIIPRLDKQARTEKISEMKQLNQELEVLEEKLKKVEEEFFTHMADYPNISHDSTPVGKDENDNVALYYRGDKPRFDFEIKNHIELGRSLDLLDDERASKVSGSRFVYMKNEAVWLEFALVQYVLGILVKKGFVPVIPPTMVKQEAMYGTGFFPAEKTQYYKAELDDLYLVGTAEVPLCSYHSDEFIEQDLLPLKYAGFSTCYRREAGAYGKDMGGMFRVHQFDKVEMFIFSDPDQSWAEYEKLRDTLEEIMGGLGFHYRIMNMCTGDIGNPNAKKYDLEAWLPGQQNYRELASCSHDTDYQARRLNIKYRQDDLKGYVHTMNSTACAIGRTLIAIYENCQTREGHIKIPSVLVPFMNGIEEIKPKK
ncbi:MAG: serine--tRNA ligase [Actinomycetia bacterium]|nr:serine--tRNA ligase [Actinomycetes bacterium]